MFGSKFSHDLGFCTLGICLCWLVVVIAGLAVAMHLNTDRTVSANRSNTAWFVAVEQK